MKNKMKIMLVAGIACAVSVVALLAGMSIYATREGTSEEKIDVAENEADSTETDALESAINSSKTVSSGIIAKVNETDFSAVDLESVPIMTWEAYEALSATTQSEEETSTVEVAEPGENELSMEEAGMIGLKYIYYIYGENMEDMRLVMTLQKAGNQQTTDLWMGYLVNEINGEEASDKVMKNYTFKLDALTGELLSLARGRSTLYVLETLESEMTTEEEIMWATDFVTQYGLADTEELTLQEVLREGITTVNGEAIERGQNIDEVIFSKDNQNYLAISVDRKTGELYGFFYYVEGKNAIMRNGFLDKLYIY